MSKKIITILLVVTLLLVGRVESVTLTQRLGNEYIETTVEKDETVRMIFTSKDGFRFKNWVLVEGNISINLNSNDITFEMPNENVTIEAEYDTTYQITFNSNDGTGTTTSMSIVAGRTEKLVKNTFTRSGYRFAGWSEGVDGEVIYEDEEECTPSKNLTLYAIWEVDTVIVEFNSNGGNMVSNITVTYGGTYGALPTPTKSGYTFEGWYKESSLTNQVTSTTQVTNLSTHTLYAKWKAPWNEPVVGSGMQRINWDSNKKEWVNATATTWDYNYTVATPKTTTIAGDGTAKWANAMIDGDGDGTYESYYVWIPRFTYKVTEGDGYSWNADENTGTAKTEIKFSDGTNDYTTGDYSGYSKHSAFTLKDKSGNIVKELKGFWVAKFEASNTSSKPMSKPGVQSWRDESASDMFNYGKSLNSSLGSHMLKDSEWGAVAYLTSAVGRIPYVNNCSGFYTGNAGSSQEDYRVVSSLTNKYDSVAGVKASTTHNIYGVYDMSGCAFEFTAGYYCGGTTTWIANLISSYGSDGTTYVDYYATTTPCVDSAPLGWDEDPTTIFKNSYMVPMRGGEFSSANYLPGIFCFAVDNGFHYERFGFRVALWGFSL